MPSVPEPLFERLVALGDSVVQGTQNVGVSVRSQPVGVPALLAAHVGAAFPLPLIAEPGYPPHIDDLGAVVRARLTHPEYLEGQRVDPALEPANFGIAGARLTDVVQLTCANMDAQRRTTAVRRMMRLVLNPLERPDWEILTQVDRAVAARPSLIVLWAGTNDVVESLFYPTAPVTPPPAFARLWRRLLDRLLSETDAAIAALSLPDVTVMPLCHVWRGRRTLMRRVQDTLRAYNTAILASEARSERVAVLDVEPLMPGMLTDGVSTAGWTLPYGVAPGRLTMQALRGRHGVITSGGLISFDGLHPTHTGYALLTNHLLAALERRFGLQLGRIDLESVARADPLLARPNTYSWRLLTSYLSLAYGRGVAELERQPWPLLVPDGVACSPSAGANATN